MYLQNTSESTGETSNNFNPKKQGYLTRWFVGEYQERVGGDQIEGKMVGRELTNKKDKSAPEEQQNPAITNQSFSFINSSLLCPNMVISRLMLLFTLGIAKSKRECLIVPSSSLSKGAKH